MSANNTKTYKAKIYGNRMIVSMHPFNPFKNKTTYSGKRQSKNYVGYMKKKDYEKTLKRQFMELAQLDIASDKCNFITLTFGHSIAWEDLLKAFRQFMKAVSRHFCKVEYIRGVEIQEESTHYHIHIILIFPDTPPPISNDWLAKYWGYGLSHIENNVYDVDGLIDYITLFKIGSCQKDCFNATYFPKGARIITTSYNIPKKKAFEVELSEEEYLHLVQIHANDYYNNKGKPIREYGHYYPNNNGEAAYCEDWTCVRLLDGFAESNYGTEEEYKRAKSNDKK